jgi:ribosomal protein S18 acetylase RimI-like enzyme
MQISDYPKVVSLFKDIDGMTFREADSLEATQRYLERNPDLSFVAIEDTQIVGFIMAGHDGRRGYLQHLFVLPAYRGRGIAKSLVDTSLHALSEIGIYKSHLFAMRNNTLANDFWSSQACEYRDEVCMYSFNTSDDPNI